MNGQNLRFLTPADVGQEQCPICVDVAKVHPSLGSEPCPVHGPLDDELRTKVLDAQYGRSPCEG